MITRENTTRAGALTLTASLLAAGCAAGAAETTETTPTRAIETDTAADALRQVEANLATFDDLDYNVFSNQKWTELHRSHAQNITVHWPDGHATEGIDRHIEDSRRCSSGLPTRGSRSTR
jgi:hypothetical protein